MFAQHISALSELRALDIADLLTRRKRFPALAGAILRLPRLRRLACEPKYEMQRGPPFISQEQVHARRLQLGAFDEDS